MDIVNTLLRRSAALGGPQAVAASLLACAGALARPAEAGQYVLMKESSLCRDIDYAFIGDIVEMEPYIDESELGTVVASVVTFRVERDLLGTAPMLMDVKIRGGSVAGRKDHGFFAWSDGERHLVLVAEGRGVSPRFGDLAIRYAWRLDSSAPLPPSELMQAGWREHCVDNRLVPRRESESSGTALPRGSGSIPAETVTSEAGSLRAPPPGGAGPAPAGSVRDAGAPRSGQDSPNAGANSGSDPAPSGARGAIHAGLAHSATVAFFETLSPDDRALFLEWCSHY
jgi:hypothetical protein